jgi:hypothetical protein
MPCRRIMAIGVRGRPEEARATPRTMERHPTARNPDLQRCSMGKSLTEPKITSNGTMGFRMQAESPTTAEAINGIAALRVDPSAEETPSRGETRWRIAPPNGKTSITPINPTITSPIGSS